MLEKLLLSEQPERFRKARAFVKAQGLSADAVAELISSAMVQALLASTQELQPGERARLRFEKFSNVRPQHPGNVCLCVLVVEKHIFRPLEGRDALVQLIKLCDDPNLVGLKLLEHLNSVPLRDLNCSTTNTHARTHKYTSSVKSCFVVFCCPQEATKQMNGVGF